MEDVKSLQMPYLKKTNATAERGRGKEKEKWSDMIKRDRQTSDREGQRTKKTEIRRRERDTVEPLIRLINDSLFTILSH